MAINYCQFNYIDNQFKIDRSEKDIALTKILATSKDRKLELKRTIDNATSLVEEDIDKSMNKDKVGEKLLEVNDYLNFDSSTIVRLLIADPKLNKINKSERIERITCTGRCTLRKIKR